MPRNKHIAVIGGMDRLEPELEAVGRELGFTVECHHGSVSSRQREQLESVIRRADGVIVFTGINSHGAVKLARKIAGHSGVPVVLSHSNGSATARKLLVAFAAGMAVAC